MIQSYRGEKLHVYDMQSGKYFWNTREILKYICKSQKYLTYLSYFDPYS